jgi:hypothetical protein
VATNDNLDLSIDAVFSNTYNLKVLSIKVVLNVTLYINLYVDSYSRGSDLAWCGLKITEQENHCLY